MFIKEGTATDEFSKLFLKRMKMAKVRNI